jgi:hypothetical protein
MTQAYVIKTGIFIEHKVGQARLSIVDQGTTEAHLDIVEKTVLKNLNLQNAIVF